MDKQYDVMILGAGPAGMTAAIYASRAGLTCGMLEVSAPGGKLVKTFEISNYPSVSHSNGADLAYKMFEHSTAFGAEYLYGDVVEVTDGDLKKISCADGTIYYAKAVIIATGTNERKMNIPEEEELTGKGVSYCAVCDGAFFKEKVVTVIGGGNSALEESLYLTQFASKVKIVIRRDVFRAEEAIVKRVTSHPKIEIITKHVPIELITKEDKVSGIVLQHVDSNEKMIVDTEGVFPYIGADPATLFVKELGILNEQGYVIVNEKMETSIKGIYAAGDVCAKVLRQVVTATSDGAIAAQGAFHYLND